eukprot:GGOE01061582.1.p1 GENE.GGOE01061582.1~~GGOE01061582.1.p1  ORF type:complete len:334 (+),score=92.96 GGOE01061582.1:121-1122(+)
MADLLLEERLSVVIITSPSRSNPATDMLQEVVESLGLCPGLAQCPKVIVFDGFRVNDEAAKRNGCWRGGLISAAHVELYEQYIADVHRLAEWHPAFQNTRLLVLDSHHGFAFALGRALSLVHTPCLMVVQHDRKLAKAVDVQAIVDVLESTPAIKYVGLTIVQTLGHLHKMRSRFPRHQLDMSWCSPQQVGGVTLIPLLQWYDSTHLTTVQYYREFVLNRSSQRVAKSGFIEDRMVTLQLEDLLRAGQAGHALYGTYLVVDPEVQVIHLDARHYLTAAQRKALGFPALLSTPDPIALQSDTDSGSEPVHEVESALQASTVVSHFDRERCPLGD